MSMSFEAMSGFGPVDNAGEYRLQARIGDFGRRLTAMVSRLARGLGRSAPSVDLGPIPPSLRRDIGLEQLKTTDARLPSYGLLQSEPLWALRPRFPATLWGLQS